MKNFADQAVIADITGLFSRDGRLARATLPRGIFLPGVTYIVSTWNTPTPDGLETDRRRIALSWEPAVDIADASRHISATEIEACKAAGVEYVELPVAFDGIAIAWAVVEHLHRGPERGPPHRGW